MSDVDTWHDLCDLDDVSDPGSRGFDIGHDEDSLVRLFVVRKQAVVSAYRNSCPHTGAPLEWVADQFLDVDNSFIQCAVHGALFRPEDGYCVRGPCAGRSLQALPLRVERGRVLVKVQPSS